MFFSGSLTGCAGVVVVQQRVHHCESGCGPLCHHLRPVQRSVEHTLATQTARINTLCIIYPRQWTLQTGTLTSTPLRRNTNPLQEPAALHPLVSVASLKAPPPASMVLSDSTASPQQVLASKQAFNLQRHTQSKSLAMQSHQIYIEKGYSRTAQTCSHFILSFRKKLGVVGTNRQFCVIFSILTYRLESD
jgi:hypothetical protein